MRADRIDLREDGSAVIYDYKTGRVPTVKQVDKLYAPQLPLEAAIVAGGGFVAVGVREVRGLTYFRASGRGDSGEQQQAANANPASLAEKALADLTRLIEHFDREGTAYEAQRRPGTAFKSIYDYDDYAHLARLAEWRLGPRGGDLVSASPEPLPHAADANQARASDPAASSWVSANAGTGKTEVLVRRVLRLLLAGSEPQRVLCLTYTKMAAAEMQNRLLGELASWATLSDEDLRARLLSLLGRAADGAEMQAARRLFAQTLEAKGGLKIYTIHGFCERLLQRFPLEAQVTPHFAVLDESEAFRLKGAAFDATMARAAADRDGPLGRALDKIVAVTVEDYFRKIVDTVLGKRGALARMIALHGAAPIGPCRMHVPPALVRSCRRRNRADLDEGDCRRAWR